MIDQLLKLRGSGYSVELVETKLKRAMELANKAGARFTLIIGENEMAAVQAKRIILCRGYFVLPARRGRRWYCTAVCGKPTHATIPRKNR